MNIYHEEYLLFFQSSFQTSLWGHSHVPTPHSPLPPRRWKGYRHPRGLSRGVWAAAPVLPSRRKVLHQPEHSEAALAAPGAAQAVKTVSKEKKWAGQNAAVR